MLFERLTLAYLTLVQTDRRKVYDRDLDPEAWGAAALAVAPEHRRGELQELAQGYNLRAKRLAADKDFHAAIALLLEAVRIDDSRPELLILLGTLQARNSRWLRMAAENLEQALKLGSQDPDLPALLARVRERLAGGEALKPASADNAPPRPRPGGGCGRRPRWKWWATVATRSTCRGRNPINGGRKVQWPCWRAPGGRSARSQKPARGGKSELPRAAGSLTTRRGDATESATENRPPGPFGSSVRVKRCGKSAPLGRRRTRLGKPLRSKTK